MTDMPRCEHCRFYYKELGECRIRSVPGDFPRRLPNAFCGEWAHIQAWHPYFTCTHCDEESHKKGLQVHRIDCPALKTANPLEPCQECGSYCHQHSNHKSTCSKYTTYDKPRNNPLDSHVRLGVHPLYQLLRSSVAALQLLRRLPLSLLSLPFP